MIGNNAMKWYLEELIKRFSKWVLGIKWLAFTGEQNIQTNGSRPYLCQTLPMSFMTWWYESLQAIYINLSCKKKSGWKIQ